jgi:hypothetical protein
VLNPIYMLPLLWLLYRFLHIKKITNYVILFKTEYIIHFWVAMGRHISSHCYPDILLHRISHFLECSVLCVQCHN